MPSFHNSIDVTGQLVLQYEAENRSQEEIWKAIPGFNDRYFVSNLGRVKSVGYYVGCRKSQNPDKPERLLVPGDNGVGYKAVFPRVNGIPTKLYVHRLVAEAFIPNPENKLEVNHINGKPGDNNVQNLEWVTRGENISHAIRTGLYKRTVVKKIKPAPKWKKLTPSQVLEIRAISGMTHEAVGRLYGVHQGTISNIMSRKSYKNL